MRYLSILKNKGKAKVVTKISCHAVPTSRDQHLKSEIDETPKQVRGDKSRMSQKKIKFDLVLKLKLYAQIFT